MSLREKTPTQSHDETTRTLRIDTYTHKCVQPLEMLCAEECACPVTYDRDPRNDVCVFVACLHKLPPIFEIFPFSLKCGPHLGGRECAVRPDVCAPVWGVVSVYGGVRVQCGCVSCVCGYRCTVTRGLCVYTCVCVFTFMLFPSPSFHNGYSSAAKWANRCSR